MEEMVNQHLHYRSKRLCSCAARHISCGLHMESGRNEFLNIRQTEILFFNNPESICDYDFTSTVSPYPSAPAEGGTVSRYLF